MKNPVHFYVRPRYTPGSPGMVSQELAERIAREEKDSYETNLTGIYGQAGIDRANKLGLFGISESKKEMKKGWEVHDLITGETYLRPFNS